MNASRRPAKRWLALGLSLACLGLALPATGLAAESVFFLVRHAEKTADSSDPPLTAAGQARARELALLLRDANIDHVHSSDYARTRDTAAPIARQQGLEIEIYDPRDLQALSEKLRATPGRHLVVGHSNTTPELAERLGGDAGPPIDEVSEHDRLYLIRLGPSGNVTSVLLRYGEP